MARLHGRRDFVRAGLAVGAALGAGTLGFPAAPRAQSSAGSKLIKVNYVTLATGSSVIINEYMSAKRFDLRHGIDLTAVNAYTSVSNYYNDFAAGTFDLAIGSWDTYAAMYGRGIPIKLVCTATTANLVNIVAAKSGPSDLAGLKGKTLAAVEASGSYKLSRMVIRDVEGIDLGKDVTVQNVPSPAQAITMVMADSAAAGLSWEPNVSMGLARVPGMRPIFNLGAAYKKHMGKELPYFTYGIRDSALTKGADVAARVAGAFADCIGAIIKDPEEAIRLAAPKMQVEAAVLRAAFQSGRLEFRVEPMSDPAARKLVKDAADYMHKNGGLEKAVDDGFFAA